MKLLRSEERVQPLQAVVLGVDSSTQSTKVIAVNLETGAVLAEGRAPHSGSDVQDPRDWWEALRLAVSQLPLNQFDVRGMSVGGQQHGLVTLDAHGQPVLPAPLWNNVAAAPDAERLNGLTDFPAAIGSSLVASFTIAKVAHLARTSPAELDRIDAVCLPHDYVTFRLTDELTTDRSDASGTGWWSAAEETYRRELLALATYESFADRVKLPTVLGPNHLAGHLSECAASELGLPAGIPVGPGAGDNAAAALGIGATTEELVISLGTSGVAFAVSDIPTFDHSGEVCGFADASGRFLPLACMINCTRAVDSIATLFGWPVREALDRARAIEPGAQGLWMLPYFGGERTPNLPASSAELRGMRMDNLAPELLVRAAVDGVAAGLAYCKDALDRLGVRKSRVTLVGGGSQHTTWQQAIADATGLPVSTRDGSEHVARGAAIQMAAILKGISVLDLATSWRPVEIATAEPRPELFGRFRFGERLDEIERLRTVRN
jgi:xylulokinase